MNKAVALHSIENEQRVLDTDLAERLGMIAPRNVRTKIIATNLDELKSHGEPCTRTVQTGGRPATAFYLNEEQALLVCMFSRTVNAQAVRKQVIDTFMAVRRGELQPAVPALPSVARWEGGSAPHVHHGKNIGQLRFCKQSTA